MSAADYEEVLVPAVEAALKNHDEGALPCGRATCSERAHMVQMLALREVNRPLVAQGMTLDPSSPEDMAALMRLDSQRWASVVKRAGIKAE